MKLAALLTLLSLPALAADTHGVSWTPSQDTNAGTAICYGLVSRFDTYVDPVNGPDWQGGYDVTNEFGHATSVTLAGLRPGATYYASGYAYVHNPDGSTDVSGLANEISFTLTLTNIITLSLSPQITAQPFALSKTNPPGNEFFRFGHTLGTYNGFVEVTTNLTTWSELTNFVVTDTNSTPEITVSQIVQ